MPWNLLIQVFLVFLAPVIQKWLDTLFARTQTRLKEDLFLRNPANMTPENAELIVWDTASKILAEDAAKTWFFNVLGHFRNRRKRQFFDLLRSHAARHSGEFYNAAFIKDATVPVLSKKAEEMLNSFGNLDN